MKHDGGEQERAPSREREGPGEAAPAAGLRPQRTSQDRAGLCGDAGVPVGESARHTNKVRQRFRQGVNNAKLMTTAKQPNSPGPFSTRGVSAFQMLHLNRRWCKSGNASSVKCLTNQLFTFFFFYQHLAQPSRLNHLNHRNSFVCSA